jgi:hypothetical protein
MDENFSEALNLYTVGSVRLRGATREVATKESVIKLLDVLLKPSYGIRTGPVEALLVAIPI